MRLLLPLQDRLNKRIELLNPMVELPPVNVWIAIQLPGFSRGVFPVSGAEYVHGLDGAIWVGLFVFGKEVAVDFSFAEGADGRFEDGREFYWRGRGIR